MMFSSYINWGRFLISPLLKLMYTIYPILFLYPLIPKKLREMRGKLINHLFDNLFKSINIYLLLEKCFKNNKKYKKNV